MSTKIGALVFMLLSIYSGAHSQDLAIKDPVTGKYFSATAYADFKGTPFLTDEWIAGNVSTSKGLHFNTSLKFNLFNNTLCLNKGGETLEISDDIKSFTLMPVISDSNTYRVFIKGIVASGVTAKQFVEKLETGKYTLYKLNAKVVRERNEINVGIVKTFTDVIRYYISDGTVVKPIEPDKKLIPEVLADKRDQVKEYIVKEKLSLKTEKDLIKVIRFYNAL